MSCTSVQLPLALMNAKNSDLKAPFTNFYYGRSLSLQPMRHILWLCGFTMQKIVKYRALIGGKLLSHSIELSYKYHQDPEAPTNFLPVCNSSSSITEPYGAGTIESTS